MGCVPEGSRSAQAFLILSLSKAWADSQVLPQFTCGPKAMVAPTRWTQATPTLSTVLMLRLSSGISPMKFQSRGTLPPPRSRNPKMNFVGNSSLPSLAVGWPAGASPRMTTPRDSIRPRPGGMVEKSYVPAG